VFPYILPTHQPQFSPITLYLLPLYLLVSQCFILFVCSHSHSLRQPELPPLGQLSSYLTAHLTHHLFSCNRRQTTSFTHVCPGRGGREKGGGRGGALFIERRRRFRFCLRFLPASLTASPVQQCHRCRLLHRRHTRTAWTKPPQFTHTNAIPLCGYISPYYILCP